MIQYVFTYDDNCFIIRADDEASAIRIFTSKIRGKHGFFDDITVQDIKDDIAEGSIGLMEVTEL